MIDGYSRETTHFEETLRDILFLVAWGGVLFLCALTLKNYYLAGKPPFWDNAVYQQKTLHIFTDWLEGDSEKAWKSIFGENFPAYLILLAISFLLFGLNPISPYMVSALFGVACIIVVYLLSRELGASKRTAFWGTLAFSLLPNFIYQNFLQTRNDFPLAFFIGLSWVFLLQGIRLKNLKLAFCAGVIAGVGTLFKASAPGYVAWGILAFLMMPGKYIQRNIKDRIRLIFLFIGGFVLSCGWHFLPNLSQILSHYTIWGNAKTWVMSQYNLQANWTNHFFYLKNIFFFHLGEKVSIGAIFVCGVLLIRWSIIKRSINFKEKHSKELPFLFLVLMAGILPIIFISLNQSFSSLGDVPVLPLVASGSLAFVSRISCGITIPKIFLTSLLPACLILSISNLPIIEKRFLAKDLAMFSRETMSIRQKFGLENTPMIHIFSHPIYNVDSLAWLWLMDPKIDKNLVHKTTKKHLIFFPEDAETIALKLTKFSFLIKSEFPGTIIKGEPFHTFNRLHSKINSAIKEQDQFIKLKTIKLEDNKFPIHFLINKNFSMLRPKGETVDGWLDWEGEVDFFSSRKTKFLWRGFSLGKVDSFNLVYKDSPTSSIKMTLHQILPNGKHEYQSEVVPATDKLITFIIKPTFSDLFLPASKRDKRMLAFNDVETEAISYD